MNSGDPFSSPTERVAASSRAKRDATFAQLPDLGNATFSRRQTPADPMQTDSESSARIKQKAQAFSSQMEKASLERRLLAAEAEKKELEIRLTQKERLVAKLESDRRWLADREKEEREEKEQERREREEEKRNTATTIRNLRVELSTLRDEHAELQDSVLTLKRTSSQTINTQKSHVLELTRQAAIFEEELTSTKQLADEHERNTQALRSQLDLLMLEKEDGSRRLSDDDNWRVVREELHRQVAHMHTLESTNMQLAGELALFKERHTSVEVLKEEKRDLERKARAVEQLREKVARLEAELEAGRLEREQWARQVQRTVDDDVQRAPPSVSLSKDLAELRLKNALLQEEQGAVMATLRRREAELSHAMQHVEEAEGRVARLEGDIKELRHNGSRRDRRLELAEREVGFLKALVASFNAEEGVSVTDPDEAKLGRIQNLEELVESLKSENDRLEQEVIFLGDGMRQGSRLAELTTSFEEERARREALEQELTTSHTTLTNTTAQLTTLSSHIETLEQALFELRGDIASGAHIPPGVRVLEMRDNPVKKWEGLRESVVEGLRRENEALMSRVEELEENVGVGEAVAVANFVEGEKGVGDGGGEHHLVPRESWERVHKEKCDLEEVVKQKEKRLLRLQQVFSSKAHEFREAMSSILGFKVHFFSNGQVKVTSQYDLNTSFVFQPTQPSSSSSNIQSKHAQAQPDSGNGNVRGGQVVEEDGGDDGTTMQLVGAGDSSLPDLARTVDYWVKQRMCIPGLMASVTLECYDKTRRGGRQAWGAGG